MWGIRYPALCFHYQRYFQDLGIDLTSVDGEENAQANNNNNNNGSNARVEKLKRLFRNGLDMLAIFS